MRLGFCGSPAFAVPVLEAILGAGHQVGLVVTRADRRRGRGATATPTPVGAAAERHGLEVGHRVGALAEHGLDAAVVVAFGALVPAATLDAVPVVNLHLSLLPRWRGAAPVERAILAGDERTGVCVMALEPSLDTGPIFSSASTDVDDKRRSALRDELVALGTPLLLGLLAEPPSRWPTPTPQRGEPTYAAKLDDAEYELDFSRPAELAHRVVRLERARTWAGARRLVVLEADVVDEADGAPGTLRGDVVACARGGLRLRRVVPEGRPAMSAADWLRGLRERVPATLGASARP